MECERARYLMMDALDGAEHSELQRHAAWCPVCARDWRALLAVDEVLRRQGPIEPPDHLASRVMRSLEALPERRPRWHIGLLFTVVLALILVLVSALAATVAFGGLRAAALIVGGADLVTAARHSALDVGTVVGALVRPWAAGAGCLLLAMVVALAWFGALVVPRHMGRAEVVADRM